MNKLGFGMMAILLAVLTPQSAQALEDDEKARLDVPGLELLGPIVKSARTQKARQKWQKWPPIGSEEPGVSEDLALTKLLAVIEIAGGETRARDIELDASPDSHFEQTFEDRPVESNDLNDDCAVRTVTDGKGFLVLVFPLSTLETSEAMNFIQMKKTLLQANQRLTKPGQFLRLKNQNLNCSDRRFIGIPADIIAESDGLDRAAGAARRALLPKFGIPSGTIALLYRYGITRESWRTFVGGPELIPELFLVEPN